MATFPIPLCASCSRKFPILETDLDARMIGCDAFPTGIPDAIWEDGFDHRKPYKGDGGIRYEMAPGADEMLAAYEAGL